VKGDGWQERLDPGAPLVIKYTSPEFRPRPRNSARVPGIPPETPPPAHDQAISNSLKACMARLGSSLRRRTNQVTMRAKFFGRVWRA